MTEVRGALAAERQGVSAGAEFLALHRRSLSFRMGVLVCFPVGAESRPDCSGARTGFESHPEAVGAVAAKFIFATDARRYTQIHADIPSGLKVRGRPGGSRCVVRRSVGSGVKARRSPSDGSSTALSGRQLFAARGYFGQCHHSETPKPVRNVGKSDSPRSHEATKKDSMIPCAMQQRADPRICSNFLRGFASSW